MRRLAFWDTSALVPLCVPQAASAQISSLSNNFDAAVWWATPLEIAGALARLERMEAIGRTDHAKATKLAEGMAQWWHVIEPSDELLVEATQIVRRYDLRSADALQLAAAMEWCDHKPFRQAFFSLDKRLREAAQLSGFDARPVH